MTAFFASLWGKAMTGAAVVLFIAAAFFLDRWVGAREQIQEARDATVKAEAELERTRAALASAEARAQARATQAIAQRADEQAVRDEPETFDCPNSPAISRALGILRQRREGDSPAAGGAAQPPELR